MSYLSSPHVSSLSLNCCKSPAILAISFFSFPFWHFPRLSSSIIRHLKGFRQGPCIFESVGLGPSSLNLLASHGALILSPMDCQFSTCHTISSLVARISGCCKFTHVHQYRVFPPIKLHYQFENCNIFTSKVEQSVSTGLSCLSPNVRSLDHLELQLLTSLQNYRSLLP